MRRSPIKHQVRSHTRAGVPVNHYERGKGGKPAQRATGKPRRGGPGYTVNLYFDGGSETHKVPATTFTDAAKQGLQSLQAPKIPRRMQIRRVKR